MKWAAMTGVALMLLVIGAMTMKLVRSPAVSVAASADSRRLGVLYFEDQSETGELRYLADGITESLIKQLSQVASLDVVSRNGVLPLRGAWIPVDSIGRLLRVGTVVRGSVEPRGNGVRVEVRLVDAPSGADLARRSFEFVRTGVLTAQDTVAERGSL